jgi:hypothetical protein
MSDVSMQLTATAGLLPAHRRSALGEQRTIVVANGLGIFGRLPMFAVLVFLYADPRKRKRRAGHEPGKVHASVE